MIDFFLALVIKHFIVDLGMQPYLGKRQKQKYISDAHQHYMEHSLGTLIVCIFFIHPVGAFACALLDYLAHWHVDFAKHRINNWLELRPRSYTWWWTNVGDQIAHILTYYALVIIFM